MPVADQRRYHLATNGLVVELVFVDDFQQVSKSSQKA